MFFDQQIALLNKEVESKEAAFRLLTEEFLKNECVTEAYLDNVIKREAVFPTGLMINGIGVAIPHTDSQYVKRSQVGFLSLTDPLPFIEMGTRDKRNFSFINLYVGIKGAARTITNAAKLDRNVSKKWCVGKVKRHP